MKALAVSLAVLIGLALLGGGFVSVPNASDPQRAAYEQVVQERGLAISPAALVAVDAVRFHQDFGQVTPESINETADLFAMCLPFQPVEWFFPASPALEVGQAFWVPRSGTMTYLVSDNSDPVTVKVLDAGGILYPSGSELQAGQYQLITQVPNEKAMFRLRLTMTLQPCGPTEVNQVMDKIGLEGDDRQMVLHMMAMYLPQEQLPVKLPVNGYYVWPVEETWPITSRFGMRLDPVTGDWRTHEGVDIGAPLGTVVHAADDGVVAFAGVDGGYGNVIWLNHDAGGIATVYGHLDTFLVLDGMHVHKGAPIGRVGSTGKSTGPHLHFEWRVGGVPVDPLPIYGISP
jgi:hypothetical protein